LERGIGICGDASMIMSQILDEQNISNKILTFPGHVVVAATFEDGKQYILDADFGVVIPYPLNEFATSSPEIAKLYSEAGSHMGHFLLFQKIYKENYKQWDGVQHFITNKYYFEKFAYWLKWPLPIFMILIGVLMWRKNRTK
jgi:alpha-ketoglutarate-dependent taurine dioxygenase